MHLIRSIIYVEAGLMIINLNNISYCSLLIFVHEHMASCRSDRHVGQNSSIPNQAVFVRFDYCYNSLKCDDTHLVDHMLTQI